MKKKRKETGKRARKRKEPQLRVAATTSEDKAIRESEAKFRSLVEGTVVPIGITDLTGNFTYVNKALADLMGYTVEELVGRAFIEFLHPEDAERVLSIFLEGVSTSKEAPEIEFRATRKDGQVLHLFSKPTRFEIDGETVGFQAILVDLTQRKLVEEALRREEQSMRLQSEMLQKTFNSMSDAIFILDAGSLPGAPKILECNEAASSIFGYSKAEMLGKSTDFLHASKDSLREFQSQLYPAMGEGRRPFHLTEFRMKRKDGSVFPSEHFVAQFLNEKGERSGWVSIVRDITERKKTEEKLASLHRHATELSIADSVEKVAKSTLDAMEFTLGFDHACFVIVERGSARVKDSRGLPMVSSVFPLDGPGVVVKVARTGNTLRIDDTRNEEAFIDTRTHDTEESLGMLSELAVPVILDGKTVAVLNIESAHPAAFTEGDQMLLEIVGMHVSSAMNRLRQVEALQSRVEQLAALQATVLDITTRRDLPMLLRTIVERAAKLLGAHGGGMYLCDPEQQEVRCVVSYNTPRDYTGTVLKYGQGAAGIVAKTGKPLMIDDYREWENRALLFEQDKPFTAVLSVPMIWQDQVTGVIDILEDATFRRFSKADKDLLTLFANHAAIAVENARLLDQVQQHSQQLEQLVFERTRKLSESERRFRELVDLLPQIVFEIDAKGNLQFMNRAAFAATGRTEEEFREGLNAFHMFAPDEHDRAVQGIQRVMSGETVGGREFTVLRKDGTTFPGIVYAAPIIREGKTAGLRGIAIDITQRKNIESALRESENQLRLMADSFPALISYVDVQEHYRFNNKTYEEWFGLPLTEITGQHIRKVLGDQVYEKIRPHVESALSGHATSYEDELPYKSSARFVSTTYVPHFDEQGHVKGFFSLVSDITERKKMEGRLAESQRLAAIGETTAMVGHDLRNPLQAIASTLYLLRKRYESMPEDQRKVAMESGVVDMFETIDESVYYMNKVVSDLQDYAAPLKLEPTHVSIGQLLNEIVSATRIPSNVKVSIVVQESFPRLTVDSVMIERVFTNLIMNAIQAMPEGGELRIVASKANGEALISLQDTGVGIPKENLSKLFNPFFTTKARGQGLGLPVCRRLVNVHGGSVSVESTVGKGSTFTVRLPISKDERR